MNRSLRIMFGSMTAVFVLCAALVAGYFWWKHHQVEAKAAAAAAPTPQQSVALQVSYPQTVTNLESSGLVQFTMTLQASNAQTKTELGDLTPAIEDKVNLVMRTFSKDQLVQSVGVEQLKTALLNAINPLLTHGKVTQVYLSQLVVD